MKTPDPELQELLKRYDLTGDGSVTPEEMQLAKELIELELREKKNYTQKKMAWIAMLNMVVFSVLLFTPWISEGRVSALSDLIGLFYLAQAGVVGAYMGFTTWLGKN